MAFAVKYFPHYDEYLQGERAARMLADKLEVTVLLSGAGGSNGPGSTPWSNRLSCVEFHSGQSPRLSLSLQLFICL
jgi:hypothetical protein